MADGAKPGRKVDVEKAAAKKPPYDLELIKQSIFAHRQATGEWPTLSSDLLHGPYAGKQTWQGINGALSKGMRGLPGGSSVASLSE
jgi:hypothetical protein